MREALRDGTIDVICTDHAPHHYDAKEREFADAPNGIIGLETALGLAITELVESGLLDLPTLVRRMSEMPARIFRLPGGTLARGSAADVVVFDPGARWTVRARGVLLEEPEHAIRRARAAGPRGLDDCEGPGGVSKREGRTGKGEAAALFAFLLSPVPH